MKKVPFAFQNAVRNVYFNLLKRFAEDENLILDLENFDEDVIIKKGFLGSTTIIAVIESHSQWGEPDGLTNEYSKKGLNKREYNGLQITVHDNKFRKNINKIADNLKNNLEEDVLVRDNG